ncbi:MAG TPA: DEAD/DEAH box helicase [Nitrospiria bacterium]|nr:DEAD/DEAH box helicase [Nitrospiria bacterium]
MSFESLGLAPEILRAVEAQKYEKPTPIQEKAIPIIMEGSDLIGCAQTGTGKTAGFTLPVLHRLREGRPRMLRTLVLVPTRELAAQVYDSICLYGKYLNLHTAVVFGGVKPEPQRRALRKGVDILVATPGRLLDHMRQGNVRFKKLEVLVIDEADRMLDMGFIPDIRKILGTLPAERQTLLFSATMPKEVRTLADDFLKKPQTVEVARQGTPASGIRQVVYPVSASRKKELLTRIIEKEDMSQVLIFTRTKHRADDLAKRLSRNGKAATAFHSNKSQAARIRSLEDFRRGKVQILVATNIAARGLDVKGVSHVINYEIPGAPEDYVHRIGRTARAEAVGDAVSLMAPEESGIFRNIERLVGSKIPRVVEPGFENGSPDGTRSEKKPFPSARAGRGKRKSFKSIFRN